MALERLQKIIAAAGIASRRKAEELISAGQVKVNGAVVTELGTKADADVDDHIFGWMGSFLQGAQNHVYLPSAKLQGLRHDGERSRKAPYCDAVASRREEARVSRGTARLRE